MLVLSNFFTAYSFFAVSFDANLHSLNHGQDLNLPHCICILIVAQFLADRLSALSTILSSSSHCQAILQQ